MSNRVIFPLLGEGGGSGSTAWGQITGNLNNQTDLKNALDLKVDISGLATVATSGSYNDLSNKPTIPTATSDLNNDSGFITLSDVPAQVQANWNESDTTSPAYIVGKPSIPAAQVNADWNAVSGVAEILNKPTIPAAQIQSDWNQSDNQSLDFIKNKPSIPAAQVNSDWNASSGVAEILNKPSMSTETLTFVDANNISTTVVVYTQPQI